MTIGNHITETRENLHIRSKFPENDIINSEFKSVEVIQKNRNIFLIYTLLDGTYALYHPWAQFGITFTYPSVSPEHFKTYIWNDSADDNDIDLKREYYNVMTDGQGEDYNDFCERGGNIDDLVD